MQINPDTDLEVVRHLKAPPSVVWRCWTDPELFRQWYAPRPMRLDEVVMDLRPGGRFFMVMVAPNGQRFPNEGAFLLVEPQRRLVFTDLMTEDYAPVEAVNPEFGPSFTAMITFTPEGTGTRYQAMARHLNAEQAKMNLDQGFSEGWGKVTDQLDSFAQGLVQ